MRIAIIVAMGKELDLLLHQLESPSTTTVDHFTFHRGTIGRHEVIAMQCGIGKVNAAMGTLTMIHSFHPQCVINTGVAGGVGGNVSVMDVVAGERVAYHDVWCGFDPDTEAGAVQGLPLYFRGSEMLLAAVPAADNVKRGLICSGDQFIDSAERLDPITRRFPDAMAVDMESGAIAHVCHVMQVPFLSLRVISDSPGANDDNTGQYNDFWTEAPQHTFALLKQMLAAVEA